MDAFLEWLSSQTLINYPFKENATLASTGTFAIPQDAILDLTISGVDESDRVYLREMFVGTTLVTLTFASVDLAADIISISIPKTEDAVRDVFGAGADPDDKYSVRVVPGDSWASLDPIFTHEFTLGAAEIEPSAVIPEVPKVLSLDNLDSPFLETPGRLTGVVYVADGCNMEAVIDEADNSVSFNALPGAGLGPKYGCTEEEEVPRCIRTINGITADDFNNFKVEGSECIEIRMHRDLNMIAVWDHCRPCCDCDILTTFDGRITTLEGFHP